MLNLQNVVNFTSSKLGLGFGV